MKNIKEIAKKTDKIHAGKLMLGQSRNSTRFIAKNYFLNSTNERWLYQNSKGLRCCRSSRSEPTLQRLEDHQFRVKERLKPQIPLQKASPLQKRIVQ